MAISVHSGWNKGEPAAVAIQVQPLKTEIFTGSGCSFRLPRVE
jgi:hypothetical protein